MSVELQIKHNTLAYESRLIRRAAKAAKRQATWLRNHGRQQQAGSFEYQINSLTNHRREIVRVQSRATNLARAYLAGRPYREIESSRKKEKESQFRDALEKAYRMVNKYGESTKMDELLHWSSYHR